MYCFDLLFEFSPINHAFYISSFVSFVFSISQDQQVPVGRPNPDPHKLDLMAENSSLKVRLAKLERHLQDSDEKFSTAQVCSI